MSAAPYIDVRDVTSNTLKHVTDNARKHARKFHRLSVAAQVNLIDSEVQNIAREVRSIALDIHCKSLGITRNDADLMEQWAQCMAYKAAEWRWVNLEGGSQAIKIERQAPHRADSDIVKQAMARRPKPVPQPLKLPPNAPPLPTRDNFIGWDEWVASFVKARRKAIAEGRR